MKIAIESFKTLDGGDTMSVSPVYDKGKNPSWYVWIKPNGSGILVVDSQHLKVDLPKQD